MALRNMTITVDEEVARWVRVKAAEENTSVSKLVGRMLAREMAARPASYWKAYELWKTIKPIEGIDAGNRPSRDEIHERR